MAYSYDRTENFTKEARLVAPDPLYKLMKDSVESLLRTRVMIRSLWEALDDVAEDASGVYFKDNYNNPSIKGVSKELYGLDHTIGSASSNIEFLERSLRKMDVK